MAIGTTLDFYDTIGSECIAGKYESAVPLTSTIGMLTIFSRVVIDDHYKLASDLIAEVKVENGNYIISDYQIEEYGIGNSLEEAGQDLLYSLVDYLASLEKRELRLADGELRNLQLLRHMLVAK